MSDRATQPERTDLSNRQLHHVVVGLVIVLIAVALFYLLLSNSSSRPGEPLQQTAAIVGSLFLLMPFVFSFKKRAGNASVPNRMFVLHVVASTLGIALVCVHAFASFAGPPLAMLLCLGLLVVTGFFGRVIMARAMAATLGTKAAGFYPADEETKSKLRTVLDQKRRLLERLDAEADEAVFSVTVGHWLRSPRDSFGYQRLVAKESRLLGTRASVPAAQAWWRVLHQLLAWGFLFGLIVHVIVATFFAGYAAEGREIYWWHISAW